MRQIQMQPNVSVVTSHDGNPSRHGEQPRMKVAKGLRVGSDGKPFFSLPTATWATRLDWCRARRGRAIAAAAYRAGQSWPGSALRRPRIRGR
jgi:hypothetical protein